MLGMNNNAVKRIRSLTSIVTGSASGIIGLEGWSRGLFLYLCMMFLANAALIIRVRMISASEKEVDLKKGLAYSKKELYDCFPSSMSVFFHDFIGCTMGYLLFWTLIYGIIHVYE